VTQELIVSSGQTVSGITLNDHVGDYYGMDVLPGGIAIATTVNSACYEVVSGDSISSLLIAAASSGCTRAAQPTLLRY
jgi:hypothetical protein